MDENDLLETLSKIKYAIRNNEFDLHLWAGDINADFLRNTSHTRTVSDTIEELGLSKSWDSFNIDFTCCHELAGVSHTSILDHFFWSRILGEAVTDAGVLHVPDNKSDHSLFTVLLIWKSCSQLIRQYQLHINLILLGRRQVLIKKKITRTFLITSLVNLSFQCLQYNVKMLLALIQYTERSWTTLP